MKTNLYNFLILGSFFLLASSCDLLERREDASGQDEERKPIARVNSSFLYPEDLDGLVSDNISPADSARRAERYVNSWIRNQLLIDEASKNMDFDEAEIERKIQEYRFSLIGYEYQSFYVNQNLNTDVTDDEALAYYNENLDNFPLKQNIIRGRVVKLPKETPGINQVRGWIQSNNQENLDDFRQYCLTYSTLYSLEDSLWINFDELIKSSLASEIPDKAAFLKRNKYNRLSDEESIYYFYVHEYKTIGDTAPVEIVYDQIRNIIINKRKVELSKNLEQDVYERAKKNNEFEIYSN